MDRQSRPQGNPADLTQRADRPEGEIADIQHGWDVYGSDEQKVGNVSDVQADYLVVHKGIFFGKDLSIPFSAIRRIEHDRVYLNVAKDEVDAQGWDALPGERGTTSAATTATAGPPPVPDRIGTPGLEGTTDEGGRAIRAGEAVAADTGAAVADAGAVARDTARPVTDRVETTGTPMAGATGGDTIHLHEEELRATKERVQTGEVRIGKEVVEEQKTVDVPVTREEVYIERTPGDRQPDDHTIGASAGETISVPVTEERVDVEKVPVVTEELRVGTRQVQENQQVTDTVKREELRVENAGAARVAGDIAAAGRWEEVMPGYRDAWQRAANPGARWEDAEPSYRYGWEMANDPRYRGRPWSEAEPALRRDWEASHPETPWERAGRDIRAAWDRVTGRG